MEKEKLHKKKAESTIVKSAWEALTTILTAIITLLASSISILDFLNLKSTYTYIIAFIVIIPILSIYIFKSLNKEPSQKIRQRLFIIKVYENALDSSNFNPTKE